MDSEIYITLLRGLVIIFGVMFSLALICLCVADKESNNDKEKIERLERSLRAYKKHLSDTEEEYKALKKSYDEVLFFYNNSAVKGYKGDRK